MESSELRLGAVDASLVDLQSADPMAVARAVRHCADRLRSADWETALLVGVVEALVRLARDPSPRVRQAVAEAAPYLPEATFREIVPALAKDKSPYVRDATERAERRRSELRRNAAQGEEHDSRVDGWYREIDKKGARAIARRIASHETEYFVRRMYHEAASSFPGFTEAARKLRAAIERPEIDRAQLRLHAERLEERFAFFQHVLETGKMHAKPVEPDFRRESLAELLRDEAALLPARFPDRAARIDVDLTSVGASLALDADANFLRQAIANILKNAVEAYDARGDGAIRIWVVASAAHGEADLTLAIRDAGAGMLAEDVARAFVPFGSSKRGGTGFGLYIARRVARNVHGGDLTLASTPGEGTTVTMTLPLRQEQIRRRR